MLQLVANMFRTTSGHYRPTGDDAALGDAYGVVCIWVQWLGKPNWGLEQRNRVPFRSVERTVDGT